METFAFVSLPLAGRALARPTGSALAIPRLPGLCRCHGPSGCRTAGWCTAADALPKHHHWPNY